MLVNTTTMLANINLLGPTLLKIFPTDANSHLENISTLMGLKTLSHIEAMSVFM